MTPPLLSIIIPAHNEEHRLPSALEQLEQFLKLQPYQAEMIVVENGSVDRTLSLAQEYVQRMPFLHVFHEEARGKGLAVKRGMLEAAGEFRIFCDVDFSMPVTELNRFIPPALDADIAIASREAPGAVRYHEPAYRHVIGRVFNTMVRVMALPGLSDSQCGFKCFRASAAEKLFPHQTFSGMSFDVEVLFMARKHGYSIVEVPVPWYFNADSRVKLFQDSLHMVLDLMAIRRNARKGLYDF
ncbi:MAG TPA: dolichyl-phosphate beta-glucosyltransferase [Longilinea sp.]|nr:dolichyl-phosphate beta-glucosyltransferase [Longilinea sp.]